MAEIIKKFTEEEYYKDFKFITNSHILNFNYCPYFYIEKRHGKVIELDKDYFIYGKGVDSILSKDDPEKKFFIGTSPKESLKDLEEYKKILENEISERAKGGKAPLKSQSEKLKKTEDKIRAAKNSKNKIVLTSTVFLNVMDTAKEILKQPLYRAFDNAKCQVIIATKINGVKVKCMIDKLDLKNKIIGDDKTTAQMTTFDPEMYLQQLAWYRWIVREVYGVNCDCYLAVGDKNSLFKRSSLYYASKSRIDYQEELNQEYIKKFLEYQKNNNYPTCINEEGKEMREKKCFKCDHYTYCKYSRQTEFIII